MIGDPLSPPLGENPDICLLILLASCEVSGDFLVITRIVYAYAIRVINYNFRESKRCRFVHYIW